MKSKEIKPEEKYFYHLKQLQIKQKESNIYPTFPGISLKLNCPSNERIFCYIKDGLLIKVYKKKVVEKSSFPST